MPVKSKVAQVPQVPETPPEWADVRVEPPLIHIPAIWEYKHLVRELATESLPDDRELNALGADGWELVGMVVHAGSLHVYLKRLGSEW